MELNTAFRMFTDAWRIYKKYHGIRNDQDDKWAGLIEEAGTFQRKYENCRAAMELSMTVLEQLEDESKEMTHDD